MLSIDEMYLATNVRRYTLGILDSNDQILFMNILGTIILNLYRVSEHDILTNSSSHLKKNNCLLKDFTIEDFPFTVTMMNKINSSQLFQTSNPNTSFHNVQTTKCTNLGELKIIKKNNVICLIIFVCVPFVKHCLQLLIICYLLLLLF